MKALRPIKLFLILLFTLCILSACNSVEINTKISELEDELKFVKGKIVELENELKFKKEDIFEETEKSLKEEETGEPKSDKPEINTTKLLKVGDEMEYADWKYKVEKVEFHNTLSGGFSENTAKGKYVVAIVIFTNNALYERNVGSGFIAKDELGRTFKMDTGASLGHHHAFRTESWYLGNIGSSFSATIAIAFDIPVGAKNIVMYPSDKATNVQGILLIEEVK